jgi:colanic acid/amylovoran biosynthesis glycosyltransferase
MSSTLRVLAYHRIVQPGDHPSVNPSLRSATPEAFQLQMEHLARRYHVVSLQDVTRAFSGGPALPPRAALVTFDDAYVDFGAVAWPIMRALGVPAALFVPTAHAANGGRHFWWDRLHRALELTRENALRMPEVGELALRNPIQRRSARMWLQSLVKSMPHERAMQMVERVCTSLGVADSPERLVHDWDELRALASDGVAVVPHTRTHIAMPCVDAVTLREEIRGSREDVRREIGTLLPVFCYPFGLFDARAVRAVADEGVEVCFTCDPGHNALPLQDPLRVRRTVITERTTPRIFGLRLLRSVSHIDVLRQRLRRPVSNPTTLPPVPARREGTHRIAYVMSRFPKLSETFVFNEILAVEKLGADVEVYPLLRERQPVSHPDVGRLVAAARFQPFLSVPIVRANLHFLVRHPRRYFAVLREVLSGTAGSANFFVGALGIFPKSVRFAFEMPRRGISHVHAHFATHPAVTALIIHRLTGIPFSFTAHGSDLHVDRRMLKQKIAASAFAVTISEFNRGIMAAEAGDELVEKIHVVRCGVDLSLFSPASVSAEKLGITIICVASLEEVKGHRFLIEACRILHSRGIHFRCDLIGDGPLAERLRVQIEDSRLTQHVLMHGGKPRREVAAMLAISDVAVLASYPTREGKREGIPVALMEAMATALPVVASDLSGIPELIQDGVSGILIPPGDAAALAGALERLAGDAELRTRLGAAGRRKVHQEFELHANSAALLSLIERHAAGSTARNRAEGERSTGEAAARSPLLVREALGGMATPKPLPVGEARQW